MGTEFGLVFRKEVANGDASLKQGAQHILKIHISSACHFCNDISYRVTGLNQLISDLQSKGFIER